MGSERGAAVDLTGLPVLDNHCHPVLRDQRIPDRASWRSHFSEGSGPASRDQHVAATVAYWEAIGAIARHLGCAAEEEAVLAARPTLSAEQLCGRYWADAGLAGLVVDDGYPAPHVATTLEQLGARRCPTWRVLRLETCFQRLIGEHATLGAVGEALRAELAAAHDAGCVGLKSIAAYRGGLTIGRWSAADTQAAFRQARAAVERAEPLRLSDPRLRDPLLHEAFAIAAQRSWPVQFHCGYGDTDSDLRHADPLRLRRVLEDPAYRTLPIVLLHEAYPYTRHGAYLCAVYDQVHMDLSYAVPYLGRAEMTRFTRAALGVAPWTKLLYASDGTGIPELHWLGAHTGRAVLGRCLTELVEQGSLEAATARSAGEAILHANARRLYRLPA
ncbi:MAG TPA: amidohydrolase family protein [Verrucomicrobiae bacterium]|nr:amidohydrolase family protein [Verrucomicrobiae bacterium]